MAKRAGVKDGVVMGVGSGPAMDLAKALSFEIGGDGLILAPATLGGMYAASSLQTVLLDTTEEMLLPKHIVKSAEIAFDGKYFSFSPLYAENKVLSMAHVAAALLTIALDMARMMDSKRIEDNKPEEMKAVASKCASVLTFAAESKSNESSPAELSEVQNQLLEATLQLSRQQSHETIPQILTNALLPTYFPQNHIFTYLGCILPGLCETLESGPLVGEIATSILENNNNEATLKHNDPSTWSAHIAKEAGIPSMASLAFGTPDVKTLLNKVDAYTTLKRSDNDLYLISEVLERSLNR